MKKDLNFYYYEQDKINGKYLEKSKEIAQIRKELRKLEYELKQQNELEKKNKENEIKNDNKENELEKESAQVTADEKIQEIPSLLKDSHSIELNRNVSLIENSTSPKEFCSPMKPILRSKPKRVSFSESISTKHATQSISKQQNTILRQTPRNNLHLPSQC